MPKKLLLIGVSALATSVVWAGPITANDALLSQPTMTTVHVDSKHSLSDSERLTKLENQVNYLSGVVQKQQSMQQSIDILRGDIEKLQNQLSDISSSYTLLSQRITQIEQKDEFHPAIPTNDKQQQSVELKASTMYQTAYNYINQRQFTNAINTFKTFVKTYPKDRRAPDAYYWLGELYLAEQQPDLASQNYRQLIQLAPKNIHAPDAMLQLGNIYLAKGDTAHATQNFQNIIKDYPNTSAAYQAKKQLDSLNK